MYIDDVVAIFDQYLSPGDRLIDVGCYDGNDTVTFAQRGYDVTAIDIRPSNVTATLRNLESHEVRAVVFREDAYNIDQWGPFEAAYCGGLLYHFEDPARFLRTLTKVVTKVAIFLTFVAEDSLPRTIFGDLSDPEVRDGLRGRWGHEMFKDDDHGELGRMWGWEIDRAFWLYEEDFCRALEDLGWRVYKPNISLDPLNRMTFVAVRD